MNEERMDMALDEGWSGAEEVSAEVQTGEFENEAGEVGADNMEMTPPPSGEPSAAAPGQSALTPPAGRETSPTPGRSDPKGGSALLERLRADARRQDMTRFMERFPGVKAEEIPQEVWVQVSEGMPLTGAYAMHENARLKAQLAAERQYRANQRRTPGALGSHSGPELDELDRMWAEED